MLRITTLCVLVLLAGCGQQEVEEGEHFWKDQMETRDRAQAVEQTLQESEKKRRQDLEEQMN